MRASLWIVLVILALAVGWFGRILMAPPPPPPPPPPPAAPATTGTSGTFSVTVNPVGPQTWTYAVSTNGAQNINRVELIAPINTNACSVTAPQGWSTSTSGGSIVASTGTSAAINVTISVTCDFNNGPTYLRVGDMGGTTGTIGPIAGPV